jgi:hypothetical protein
VTASGGKMNISLANRHDQHELIKNTVLVVMM